MMAQAKRIYFLMIKVNKLIFFWVSQYFLKEIENTRESLGDLKKAVQTLS